MKRVTGTMLLASLIMVAGVSAPIMVAAQGSAAVTEGRGEERRVNIRVDSQEVLRAPGATYVISNPNVVEVTQSPDREDLVITGRRPGRSEVTVTLSDGRRVTYIVNVASGDIRDLGEVYQELSRLLADIPSVSLTRAGSVLIASGTIYSREEKRRYDNIVNRSPYNQVVIDQTSYDPVKYELQRILEEVHTDLRRENINDVHVALRDRVSGEIETVIAGRVQTASAHRRALNVVGNRLSEDVVDMVRVEDPLISVDTLILTLDDTKMDEVGNNDIFPLLARGTMTIPGAVTGAGTVGRFTLGYASRPVGLELQATQTSSYISRSFQATQVVKSGNEAVFQDGGTIYVAMTGFQAAELNEIQTGTNVVVTPELRDDGMIDVRIAIDVNNTTSVAGDRDLFEGTAEVSTIRTRRVLNETIVTINDGETIVVSGMDGEIFNQTNTGTPFLQRIPLVNLFFSDRSRSGDNMRSLLVITPTLRTSIFRDDDLRLVTDADKEEVDERRRDSSRRETGVGYYTGFQTQVPPPPESK